MKAEFISGTVLYKYLKTLPKPKRKSIPCYVTNIANLKKIYKKESKDGKKA